MITETLSVVRGHDDERIPTQTKLIERGKHSAELLIGEGHLGLIFFAWKFCR